PRAVAPRGFDARGDHVGVMREPKVVVTRERHERGAVSFRIDGAGPIGGHEPPAQLAALERRELLACDVVERRRPPRAGGLWGAHKGVVAWGMPAFSPT